MSLTTIDVKNLKVVRAYCLENDMTLKYYVNDLIKKDLGFADE